MQDSPPPTLNPALRDFWTAPARNRVLYGGRSSSKSWDAAGFAIFLAQTMKLRFLCTRQFQNKIEESVYTLLKIQIERFGLLDKFRILDNKIICTATGSEFVFYGLWRHVDEIKSLEGIDVHWAEEAHLLSEDQWKIIDPTLRREGSQHWIIFNPRLSTDFVYKRFVVNPPPDTVVRKINYTENAFLSDTIRKVIEAAAIEDPDEHAHVYLGVPRDDDDNSVVRRSWLMAAIGAHNVLGIEPMGDKRIGFDIADSGADKCANVFAHGQLASWSDQWKAQEDQLLMSCTRTWNVASERGASVIYDSIGVGASAGAKFAELNAAPGNHDRRVRYEKFNAGDAVFKPEAIYEPSRAGGQAGVKNKDMFLNLKAQAWWGVADRLKATYNAVRSGEKVRDPAGLMFLDPAMPNLDKLIDELATPKRDFDSSGGRVKVESKKDLMKREVPSPNLADALVMAFAPRSAGIRITPDLLARI